MPRHGTGSSVRVRLYMEGLLIENALIGITTTASIGAASTAQLELTPTNTIKHVLQGTWVHVFVTDPWDPDPKGDLSDFKLLFEGVVIARGFNRQSGGRNFVIQCGDPSVFWTEAKQFWLNIASSGGNIVDRLVVADSGGYARLGTVNTMGIYGYMSARLKDEKPQPEERFMDTMITTLDDIGSVNPFYANARSRFRIMDRVIRGPAGDTSKLFQYSMMSDFIEGLAGRAGGQTNMVEMVNQLLSAIMHEWSSILAPPYLNTRILMRDAYGNIKRNKKTVTRKVRGTVKVDLFEYETALDDIVGSIIFKPHIYTLSPPSCNVLFPNMYDQLGFQESFLQETTRLQMQPQLPQIINNNSVNILQGTFFYRPTEVEVFQSLVRDSNRQTLQKRAPDAKFTDGVSQTATYSDYDWTTNEERIRGLVYNFINLAPAPSTLTLSDPGKKTPRGARKGGVPTYLQNVASYEYYKSKYVARQSQLAGPLNIRPIPGFPILALDDSAANLNMVAYLESITHTISASGSAMTSYGISLPRLVDEVDLNRPAFNSYSELQYDEKGNQQLNVDLLRDEDGSFQFSKIFEGANRPPIPEWFDESYRTLVGLDDQYRQWFGDNVGVAERLLFKKPSEEEEQAVEAQYKEREQYFKDNPGVKELPDSLEDDLVTENNAIQLQDAAVALNRKFQAARDNGYEFDVAAQYTNRTFTRIDQAFRFVGAGPIEETGPGGLAATKVDGNFATYFKQNPASNRQIDYKTATLRMFVGDVSPGSGYNGVPESSDKTPPATDGQADAPSNRMSGAFPVFDTELHSGTALLDDKVRSKLRADPEQFKPSDYARYDGRPLMYDFEFRLWQESLLAAGYAPNGEKLADSALASDFYVTDSGAVRPATAAEVAANTQKRKDAEEARKKKEKSRAKRGRQRSSAKTQDPSVQAPTGDGLNQEQRLPLTQPLSEKQVVDLRRAVVYGYQEELAKTRGFTG